MTEAEWNECTDPKPMLRFLDRNVTDRKLRLFAVACCRQIWDRLTDPRSREAVEVAELFADGLVGNGKLRYTCLAAHNVPMKDQRAVWAAADTCDPDIAARIQATTGPTRMSAGDSKIRRSRQAQILRDIVGNPFRPSSIDPTWLTKTVEQLSETIYTDKDFASLPILADALEEAGCTNADILNHCRQPGEHVRGCWMVDLLTGRK